MFYGRKTKQTTIPALKNVSLTFAVSLGTAYIFSAIEPFLSPYLRYPYYIFINISVAGFYLFMFLQLYHSFKQSQYKISQRMIRTHAVLSLIAEIFFIMWAALDFSEEIVPNSSYWWKQIAVVFAGLVFLLNVTHLVFTFNRNLFLLITARSQTHRKLAIPPSPCDDVPELGRQSTLDVQQHKMLNMIVKNTVLNTMDIGLGFLLCFLWSLLSLVDPDGQLESLSIIRLWLLLLLVIVTTTAMLLSFVKESKLYNPLCKKCDSGCRNLCENLAENKLDKIMQRKMNSTLKPPAKVLEMRSSSQSTLDMKAAAVTEPSAATEPSTDPAIPEAE